MRNDCTLLLSTYDGGSDLWEGFFKTLEVEWPDFNLPVVMNTETKVYENKHFDISTFQPCISKKMAWSERLKAVLSQIDTEFILLFLEDYWLDAPVDVVSFEKVLDWMKINPDVATVSFYPLPGPNIDDKKLPGYELRPRIVDYKFSCQVALWRRSRLLSFLKDKESPWEFEIIGSLRGMKYKDRFYSIKKTTSAVFSYGDPQIGCLIHRGKWNRDVIENYKNKYSIDVDCSIRGYEDWDEIYRKRLQGHESLLKKLKRPHRLARLFRFVIFRLLRIKR